MKLAMVLAHCSAPKCQVILLVGHVVVCSVNHVQMLCVVQFLFNIFAGSQFAVLWLSSASEMVVSDMFAIQRHNSNPPVSQHCLAQGLSGCHFFLPRFRLMVSARDTHSIPRKPTQNRLWSMVRIAVWCLTGMHHSGRPE
jgi:hypothetical protein